jgi:hypothetical protein
MLQEGKGRERKEKEERMGQRGKWKERNVYQFMFVCDLGYFPVKTELNGTPAHFIQSSYLKDKWLGISLSMFCTQGLIQSSQPSGGPVTLSRGGGHRIPWRRCNFLSSGFKLVSWVAQLLIEGLYILIRAPHQPLHHWNKGSYRWLMLSLCICDDRWAM